ncbi:hypothetical protein QBB34_47575 [Streptomyces stelliscabiei]|uniref:hypothetical protein n=1 Tax=Streptomyces stelliscabiei TaxID=146820 RepID=UPI002FF29DE3
MTAARQVRAQVPHTADPNSRRPAPLLGPGQITDATGKPRPRNVTPAPTAWPSRPGRPQHLRPAIHPALRLCQGGAGFNLGIIGQEKAIPYLGLLPLALDIKAARLG